MEHIRLRGLEFELALGKQCAREDGDSEPEALFDSGDERDRVQLLDLLGREATAREPTVAPKQRPLRRVLQEEPAGEDETPRYAAHVRVEDSLDAEITPPSQNEGETEPTARDLDTRRAEGLEVARQLRREPEAQPPRLMPRTKAKATRQVVKAEPDVGEHGGRQRNVGPTAEGEGAEALHPAEEEEPDGKNHWQKMSPLQWVWTRHLLLNGRP
jgi:hypothetical protein